MNNYKPEMKLDIQERKQLSSWIGGKKTYNLLYKASRDGLSAQSFHQRCDNKGPTVTLIYNTGHCVFGGYTSASWSTQQGTYVYDDKAFLFRLFTNGRYAPQKFEVMSPNDAIYCSFCYGPTFGKGHDLLSFPAGPFPLSVSKTEKFFSLPDNNRFGVSYKSHGISMNDISANNYKYLDVEVYQVVGDALMNPQWRKFTAARRDLLNWVKEFSPLPGVGVNQTNILMLGPVGSGKSSFINTINSIMREQISSQASCGSTGQSLTSVYRMYQVRYGLSPLNFQLCDTRGIEDSSGITEKDVTSLIEGHITDRYQFDPKHSISENSPNYVKSPTLADKIHCVVFVLDSSILEALSYKQLTAIKNIQTCLNKNDIPQVVLLTKVDLLVPEIKADFSSIYSNRTVEDLVNKVGQLMGLPRSNVLPIKNYENEVELDEDLDRFALVSLRQILQFSNDYLHNFLPKDAFSKLEPL